MKSTIAAIAITLALAGSAFAQGAWDYSVKTAIDGKLTETAISESNDSNHQAPVDYLRVAVCGARRCVLDSDASGEVIFLVRPLRPPVRWRLLFGVPGMARSV